MKSNTLLGVAFVAGLVWASSQPLHERQSNWTIGQTVQTDSGPVAGHAAPSATEVSEYLGIPFAQPPIGNLRFAPPLRYSGNTTIDGSAFGPACLIVQATGGGGGGIAAPSNPANLTAAGLQIVVDGTETGTKMSEDCLTLNVWTKPQTGDSKKAVMLWIYGGAFTSGSSGIPLYNGQYIADQEDVVIVSINYRINIFGFPGSPAGSYNLGLQDQRLAVEWVHDNIAAFGGDPSRITLFGQSAGAASIDFYTYAWTSDPIVNAFIEESGTTSLITPLNQSTSAAMWYNVSSTVGCGSTSSNASSVLSCMRNASSAAILKAIGSQSFTPTIDSTLVFSDYGARALKGSLIKKPLLLGNNDNEASLFRVAAILEGQDLPETVWDAYNFKNFFCPCAARANVSVYNHIPTWRYRWFGVFPNTNLTTYPDSGAYHSSEIPVIFNTPPAGNGITADTAQEQAVMAYTRGAWAAFAKDPVNGLNMYQGGWPQYNPVTNTLVRLAYDDTAGTNLALPQMYDALCGTIFPVSAAAVNATATGNATSSGSAAGTSTSTSSVTTVKSSGRNAVSVPLSGLAVVAFTTVLALVVREYV